MRKVTYSMGMSLDGFIVDAHGAFDWAAPSEEVFRQSLDEIRDVGVHLMGRRLYETMRYWETTDEASFDELEREWAGLWNPLPKLVFSRTLTEVQGNARLATRSVADEVARLRAEPADGDIAIGGATLAVEAARLGLIDEYLIRVFPILVGGGLPFFARNQRQVELELIESRVLDGGVVFSHYRRRADAEVR
ncbi:dihydrofolate reductase family protein [Microbacterium sp.]|uniref:dihydrofolate reductase family protein n=1 Tax=Microbacterium sp. TaxID=51671 RepID=UPI003C78CCFC